jgi:hypothetical protein
MNIVNSKYVIHKYSLVIFYHLRSCLIPELSLLLSSKPLECCFRRKSLKAIKNITANKGKIADYVNSLVMEGQMYYRHLGC